MKRSTNLATLSLPLMAALLAPLASVGCAGEGGSAETERDRSAVSAGATITCAVDGDPCAFAADLDYCVKGVTLGGDAGIEVAREIGPLVPVGTFLAAAPPADGLTLAAWGNEEARGGSLVVARAAEDGSFTALLTVEREFVFDADCRRPTDANATTCEVRDPCALAGDDRLGYCVPRVTVGADATNGPLVTIDRTLLRTPDTGFVAAAPPAAGLTLASWDGGRGQLVVDEVADDGSFAAALIVEDAFPFAATCR
jgi:hypothetical protein